MNRQDFAQSPSGQLVPTERSQWAFVPHPLPPSIDWSGLAVSLAAAAQALGELNGIGRTIANPYLLIRPLQTREALSSSSMEGTFTTVDALILEEAGISDDAFANDTREVANYRRALAEALLSLEDIPLSIRTLRQAHERLLSNVARHRGSAARPGELKQFQNFIGAREIENARFIPPPPEQARKCLGDLERYWHREVRGDIPDLIDAALIHYQFETIHPFSDGNGRVGRMLIPLHLAARGAIARPLLYLSPTLERRRDTYIDLMYAVSRDGAWVEWIRFFLDVIVEACRSTIATADGLLDLQRRYRAMLQGAGRSANLLAIVDQLFEAPVLSIPRVAERLGVTYRAAQMNVMALVEAGILTDVPGASNPKLFIARAILDLIAENTEHHA